MYETPKRTRQKERHLLLSGQLPSNKTYSYLNMKLYLTQPSSIPFTVFITLFMKRSDFLEEERKRNMENTKKKLKIEERKCCGVWGNFPQASSIPLGHNPHVSFSFCYLSDEPFGYWSTYKLPVKETLKHPCTYLRSMSDS